MFEGQVADTKNPQVACYSIAPQYPADVWVKVSNGTQAGFSTWTRHAQGNGVPVQLLVAGMQADTRYALKGVVRFSDGTVVEDNVHWFKTGTLPRWVHKIQMSVQDASGNTPQRGVELLNSTKEQFGQAFVTDLQGQILWTYSMQYYQSKQFIKLLRWKDWIFEHIVRLFVRKGSDGPLRDSLTEAARRGDSTPEMTKIIQQSSNLQIVNPIKLLPNGDMLLVIGLPSQALLMGPLPHGANSSLREIDLTGKTVRELTVEQLNEKLHAAGYGRLHLQTLHHDVEILPNGHWIVLANQFRPGSNPGQGETDIFGDVLIDLDTNLNPVWAWDSFDHLDIHRSPMSSPDWTHGNAVVYTPDDGNLLFSMRHQNWVIKIDYRNGKGNGEIMWRLGRDGDLRLLNGQEPTDWQYAQHLPAIVGPASAGVFRLAMMDNGNARPLSNGRPCAEKKEQAAKQPLCYTTVPLFEIDEKAKTARQVTRKVFSTAEYSTWGGNAVALPNGNIETTLTSQRTPNTSLIVEYVPGNANQNVWRMQVKGLSIYRAQRIPSLYPGIWW